MVATEPLAPMADRRFEPRQTSVLRIAVLILDEEAHLCRITNISPQGVQATVFRPVPVGSRVVMRVPDATCLAGSVIWTKDDRVGVKLNEVLPESSVLRFNNESAAVRARRRLPRVEISARAWLKSGVKKCRVDLLDISPLGALICADEQLPALGPVELQVGGLRNIGAQIRWLVGSRAGLFFNDAVALHLLASWLEQHGAGQAPRVAEAPVETSDN